MPTAVVYIGRFKESPGSLRGLRDQTSSVVISGPVGSGSGRCQLIGYACWVRPLCCNL